MLLALLGDDLRKKVSHVVLESEVVGEEKRRGAAKIYSPPAHRLIN